MEMITKLQPSVFLIIIVILFVPVTAQINLALHGTVAQETTYKNASNSYNATLAIEGPANNNWRDGCSSTGWQLKTWWGLFLPGLVYITNVKSYHREDEAQRMNEFRLYLANGSVYKTTELCFIDSAKQAYRNLNQSIDCHLSPTRNIYFFNRRTYVELCYIEIYGCWKGTWGTHCSTDCPVECIDRHCFPQNGSCIWGCDLQKCFHGECDVNTDVCTKECVSGKGGRYCTFYNTVYNGIAKYSLTGVSSPAHVLIDGNTTSCISIETASFESYIQVGNGSLIVITGVYLFFGDNTTIAGNHKVYCSNTTDSWADGTVLYNAKYDNEDIDVFAVCKYVIYMPPILNGNIKLDICEIEISGCPYGKYGDNCQSTCPKNCKGYCDLDTGNCLLGCLDGWLGETCDTACNDGTFGDQCLRDCSVNCISSHCDHVTGQCKSGCLKGFEGFNCTEECSNGYFGWNCSETCNGCIANECYHTNGVCTNDSICKPGYKYGKYCNQTCKDWHFGTNCIEMCNCLNISCNPLSGICPKGDCEKGWSGDSCDQECTSGYYGFNCMQFCGTCYNNACNKLNGSCEAGCKGGFSGSFCAIKDTQESQAGSGPTIGGSISGVIIVIVIVVLAIIIYRRRSTPQQDRFSSDNEALKRAEGNTYFNQEILQNKEDGYANMGSATSIGDIQISLSGTNAGKVRYSEETDQLPEKEEYSGEDEGGVYSNIAAEQTKHNIPISELKKVIRKKRKDDGFENEYKMFPKGLVHAHEEGSKEENKLKNRFLKTWPYDHSRIILTGNTMHDYINASYIDSYEKERAYIASQGPKKNTLRDFWHMIWQEKVGKIVMVTKLEEERRKKCEQYWPQNINRAMAVDNYKLTMKEEIHYTVYSYRLIILHNKTNKQERKVHQFHFTQWPDHGVPDSIKLVNFIRKVRIQKCDNSGPTVVHCSAGIGRTGTLIAIDALYEYGNKVGHVNIVEYVQMMRKDRMNMIQTHEQYEIVFEALLELFTVPDTSIQKDEFCGYIEKQQNKTLPKNQTWYSEECQRLRTLRPSYSSNQFTSANSKENKSKNFTMSVLAHDQYRPYLMSYGKNRSDYINAVIIPGYSVDSKMFVTQCPLAETVIDFWTMMYDHSSRIIVLLDSGNKEAPLWLEKKEMLQFDDFRIIIEKENAQEEIQLTLNHTKNQEQISINVFTADDWTISNTPPSQEYMLDLLQRVQTCWETHKGPITVVCRDGCSKSGLFVALRLVLEKIQIDEEIDIFQVVREIQLRRPEFLENFDQYEYCYKCVRVLLEGDSNDSLYANI